MVNEANPLLEPLIELLPKISQPGQQITTTANHVLPWFSSVYCENKVYFSYPGSLTTEPYYPSVAWIIFPEPITLSDSQVRWFKAVFTSS